MEEIEFFITIAVHVRARDYDHARAIGKEVANDAAKPDGVIEAYVAEVEEAE